MNSIIRTVLGSALALMSFAVLAERAYVDIEQRLSAEQVHATGLDTLSSAQLELLNRLLREESVKVTAAATPAAGHEGDPGHQAEHDHHIGLDEGPIKSRLKGSLSGWEPGTVFELENGQQWKVLKGSVKLRKTLQTPEVVVAPGIAARWFLQVDEDLPKARVYRID